MSGITPILDTLLHQVLGKRVDTPPPRELLEPVKPLTPSIAPRAVNGDSQLDAGRAGIANPRVGVGEAPARPTLPAASPLAPTSTSTHFSPAALTIADILVKFPAPPSVIQSPLPLLQDDGAANTSLLAARLQQSVESSGLFYESHLARWYRGDMSRAALEREPQMWRFQSFQPLPGGNAGTTPGTMAGNVAAGNLAAGMDGVAVGVGLRGGDAPLNPLNPRTSGDRASGDNAAVPGAAVAGRATSSQGNAALPGTAPPVTPAGAAPPGQAETPASPLAGAGESSGAPRMSTLDAIDDTLQGVIRHQLELLVTPTLRWEGDIWSGIFMALSLHLPERLDERAWDGEPGGEGDDDDPVWHSQLSLSLPRLGELDVQMYLRRASVSLTLQSESETCLVALKAGREDLEDRLRRCGFEDVRVSVLLARDDDAWESDA